MSEWEDLLGAVPDTPEELAQLEREVRGPSAAPTVDTRNPRPMTPNTDPRIGPACDPARTLTEELGGTVDEIRQLYTDFGQRPYRVFLVRYAWTGGADGLGRPRIVEQQEFLPTPHVDGLDLGTELKAAGEDETGYVTISEISPRYTEDQIRVMTMTGSRGPGEFAFLEVVMDRRDGAFPRRRRLTVSDVPWRDAEGFAWRVRAYIQEEARDRLGNLTERDLYPADSTPEFPGASGGN